MTRNDGIVRTQIAEAMGRGFLKAVAKGQNLGRLGHAILTSDAKGAGVRFAPRKRKQPREN